MGIIYQGSHVSDFVVINGEMVTRGFRSLFGVHVASVAERKLFGGGPATTALNVGIASGYRPDGAYPFLGGAKQKHWPGGVVAIYRNGTAIDADQLMKTMADAMATMKGAEYRFHMPKLTAEQLQLLSLPDAELANADLPQEVKDSPKLRKAIRKAMKKGGIEWRPCGGTNCINVPIDIHSQALGTKIEFMGPDGKMVTLADREFASTDMMSKYVQQPDEYFSEKGLTKANIGGKANRTLARAGAIGGGLSLTFDAATGNLTYGSVPRALLNAGGGVAGYVVEDWIASGISTNLVKSGITTGRAATFGRVGAAGITGAGIAPLITGVEMLFDDTDYIPSDYFARLTRSAVSGGVGAGAGALATATFFAIAGSEFPIIGNLIGFGVGLIVGLATDSAIGDPLEEEIREIAGQQGCKGYATEGW
jgi:hypothetical protein